jgi:hypothetical protein
MAKRNRLVEAILRSSREEFGLGVDICGLRGNAFSVLAAMVEASRPQPGINHKGHCG